MTSNLISTRNPYRKGGPFDHMLDEHRCDGEMYGPDPGLMPLGIGPPHFRFPGPVPSKKSSVRDPVAEPAADQ